MRIPAGRNAPGRAAAGKRIGRPLADGMCAVCKDAHGPGGMMYPYIGTTKQHSCRYVLPDHAGSCACFLLVIPTMHTASVSWRPEPSPSCIAERVPSLDRRKPAYTHASGADFCLSGTGCHGKGIPPVMRRLLPRIWPRGRDAPSQGGGAFPHSFPAYRNPAGGASSAALLSVTLCVSRRACCAA